MADTFDWVLAACSVRGEASRLLDAGFFFGCAVAPQQLGQVLGERRARQYHVASHLVRLLLQISLDMGQEADNRSSLFQFAFELGNQGQGLGVEVVEIEDDQRRILFAVLLDALQQILVGFDELHLDVHLARRFLDLGQEKQVIDKGKDAWRGILASRQRFWIGRLVSRRKSRTLSPSASMPVMIAVAQRGSIAVIHRRGVNATMVVVLAIATLSTTPTAAAVIGRAPTTTPPASPSAAGGMSGSCIHKFSLVAVPNFSEGWRSRLPCVSLPGEAPHSRSCLFDAREPRYDWKNPE